LKEILTAYMLFMVTSFGSICKQFFKGARYHNATFCSTAINLLIDFFIEFKDIIRLSLIYARKLEIFIIFI
jgi:hypothetical protein